ncbi:MAG: hypothetical protein IT379_11015 [Deltaproteobacteria bacterium]|nr:hypothetical protein [Deltaproteobacteria bacterium]
MTARSWATAAMICSVAMAGLVACETADVRTCGAGGTLETVDGSSYCVFEAGSPEDADAIMCPDDLVFRVRIGNILVCTDDGSIRSAADLPDTLCRRATISECGSAADAGSDDGGGRVDGGIPPEAGGGYRIEGDVVRGFRRGSAEGSEYRSACLEGQLMAGLDGVTSSAMAGSTHVHLLEPSCRRLEMDGSLAPPVEGNVIGTHCGGTLVPYEDRCPEGMVLVGLHGEIQQPCPPPGCGGDIVAELGLTCAPLDAWIADGSGATMLPDRGDYAGSVIQTFDDRCDPGFVVTELTGTQRCAAFSIQLGCHRVVR